MLPYIKKKNPDPAAAGRVGLLVLQAVVDQSYLLSWAEVVDYKLG
jgi:hypothetical protein